MINSRKIEDLIPAVAAMCRQFIDAGAKQGIDVLITSTYRDFEAQDALYAQGRTGPGVRVTNAKGGQSFHNYRCAFDFCPIIGGKPQWNRPDLFEQCGTIAEGLGLVWAGRFVTFKEMAHCQWSNGLTVADLYAGKRPKV